MTNDQTPQPTAATSPQRAAIEAAMERYTEAWDTIACEMDSGSVELLAALRVERDEAEKSLRALIDAMAQDAERIDWFFGWLQKNHFLIAHNFGGDANEFREGVDAARAQEKPHA